MSGGQSVSQSGHTHHEQEAYHRGHNQLLFGLFIAGVLAESWTESLLAKQANVLAVCKAPPCRGSIVMWVGAVLCEVEV